MVAKKGSSKKKEVKKEKTTLNDKILAILFSCIVCIAVLTIAGLISIFCLKILSKVETKLYDTPTNTEDIQTSEIVYWQEVVKKNPTYFPGWITLSKLYYEEKLRSKAEEAYWMAWKLDPNSEEIRELESMLYGE